MERLLVIIVYIFSNAYLFIKLVLIVRCCFILYYKMKKIV